MTSIDASDAAGEREDLSLVLLNLGIGKRAGTRRGLANQPETRMYLEAGLTLLRDDLLRHTGPDPDQGIHSRLFESLSRERILQRAKESDSERVRFLTVTMFRNRWPRKDDYTEDLIAYIFRPGPMEHRLAELDATITRPLMTLDLGQLVRHITAAVIQGMADDPLAGLQAIIEVALPSHPTVRRNVHAYSGTTLPRWADLYQRIAIAKGYRLKPGYTWLDMALLFDLVTWGVILRTRVDGTEPRLANGKRVLDAAIQAMLPSLIEPGQPGTGDLRQAGRGGDRLHRPHEREDLGAVLSHIGSGKLAATRRRLANDPDTREFLELGLGLLLDDWLRYTGPDFDQDLPSRLFGSLSRKRVLEHAIGVNPDHSESLTVTRFRNLWTRHDHYTEDLISYLFRPGPIHAYVDRMSEAATGLIDSERAAFPDLIRRFAAAASKAQAADPLFGLQAIIQAALPSYPRVREDRRAQLKATLPRWAGLYERIGAAYGLELAPDVTWLDVAQLFSLVIGGVLPRIRIYDDEPRLASGESAFAGVIMAMLPALVRPAPAAVTESSAV